MGAVASSVSVKAIAVVNFFMVLANDLHRLIPVAKVCPWSERAKL